MLPFALLCRGFAEAIATSRTRILQCSVYAVLADLPRCRDESASTLLDDDAAIAASIRAESIATAWPR
jgi:hypothetical protein